mmetsp:Transcript_10084/g.22706  ORF Transcript_10084/g.22706 Transcript_10084/m.22706 type:complete len:238 (-) Transcript_10084:813-1526(-)
MPVLVLRPNLGFRLVGNCGVRRPLRLRRVLALGFLESLLDLLAGEARVAVVVPCAPRALLLAKLGKDPDLVDSGLLPVRWVQNDGGSAFPLPELQLRVPARRVPLRLRLRRHHCPCLVVIALEPLSQELLRLPTAGPCGPHPDVEPLLVRLPRHGDGRNPAGFPQAGKEVLAIVAPEEIRDAIRDAGHAYLVRRVAEVELLSQTELLAEGATLVLLEEGRDTVIPKVTLAEALETAP